MVTTSKNGSVIGVNNINNIDDINQIKNVKNVNIFHYTDSDDNINILMSIDNGGNIKKWQC
jgi:hypothetical protein